MKTVPRPTIAAPVATAQQSAVTRKHRGPLPRLTLTLGCIVAVLGMLLLALTIGLREAAWPFLILYALFLTALGWLAAWAVARWFGRLRLARWRLIALVVIVLAGGVMRFWGIDFSLPYVAHPDEPTIVNIAQRMLVTGDLNPHRFIYPSLYIYLQALTYIPHLLWGFAQGTYHSVHDLPATTDLVTTAPGIYLWGRALTAALSTATLLLTCWIGWWLYSPEVGLLAAALLVFLPQLIFDSHTITVDAPSAFFTTLAFCAIVLLYQARRTPAGLLPWGAIVRAGVGVGLAAATKYNAALIGVPLLLVPLLRGERAPWRVWLGGGLAAGGAFLLATPYVVTNLSLFLNDTAEVITHYRFVGHANFESEQNWRVFATYMWHDSPGGLLLALGGIVWLAFRHRRVDLLILPFPLLYYAALSGLRVNFARNLLPLGPFLAIIGAVALVGMLRAAQRFTARWRWPRVWPVTAVVLALVLTLAWPVTAAGRNGYLLAARDTRVAAQEWMESSLSRSTYWLVQLPPEPWRARGNVISTAVFGPLTRYPPEWFPAHGIGYLLLNADEYRPILEDRAARPTEAAWYDAAFARFPVAREWQAPRNESRGPYLVLLDTGLDLEAGTFPVQSEARFGTGEEMIALAGYALGAAQPGWQTVPYFPDQGAGTAPLRPGALLGLTLIWRPLRTPAADYRVFVHLRDAAGRTVAQRDTAPQNDTARTHDWHAGALVLDSANLPLPATLPPGRYTVVIGLYAAGTRETGPGRRLPVRQRPDEPPLDADELPLGTIEVER